MAKGLGVWEMRGLEWDLRQRDYKRGEKRHQREVNCKPAESCISTEIHWNDLELLKHTEIV